MSTIGILIGSNRPKGNGVGLTVWTTSLLTTSATALLSPPSFVALEPYSSLPPLSSPIIPQAVKRPSKYDSLATQSWSDQVSACTSILIVTPQYNWGIPGVLKNAVDHLFWEWKGKNVFLVTYGGHGGGRCASHLRDVLGGGLDMNVIGGVEITLPKEYIRGERRVGDGNGDEFLKEYEERVSQALGKLLEKSMAAL
ncbi:hypothetical protein P7C70_g3073, partial [Phenoliferia sp. Uapishka_3]